jgi:hypothetical protein
MAPALNDSLLCCVGHQEAQLSTNHGNYTAYVKSSGRNILAMLGLEESVEVRDCHGVVINTATSYLGGSGF